MVHLAGTPGSSASSRASVRMDRGDAARIAIVCGMMAMAVVDVKGKYDAWTVRTQGPARTLDAGAR